MVFYRQKGIKKVDITKIRKIKTPTIPIKDDGSFYFL